MMSLKQTLVACLWIDVEDIVVLPVRIFGRIPVVDVNVDSVCAIEALSCRTL